MSFEPNASNLRRAVLRQRPERVPLYDHVIDIGIMERVVGAPILSLLQGDVADRVRGFANMADFHVAMGYDALSFEGCVGGLLPGGGGLLNERHESTIRTMDDLQRYPWEEIPERYFLRFDDDFAALEKALPPGMGVVGGVGNGILECAQELTGYVGLCLMRYDDPELFVALLERCARLLGDIWERFLPRWGHLLTICRTGDDMGFKNATLLAPQDLIDHVAPGYRRISALAHAHDKPFLLHSCGCIFPVMDALIDAGIDAKHSNEDVIAPLSLWLERYGQRIAIFGGIDVDLLTRGSADDIRRVSAEMFTEGSRYPGFAFGTGNSVPSYIPLDNYVLMNETVRKLRGE